ncbi:MAG: sensor histidine kinase [Synergistaceae bacterium]|jgi:signal transduction histidine kinase|nr:sensor histidine kinase [Synergistaceae bacterium]
MRRNALLLLMLLVTLLTAATLAVSIYALKAQESVTDSMLSAYVSDIAESFAENSRAAANMWQGGKWGGTVRRWEKGGWGVLPHMGMIPRENIMRMFFFRMFSGDPSLRSGGIFFFSSDGRPIAGSFGAENLATLWREELMSGLPVQVSDKSGTNYFVVMKELAGGNFVMVAASKTNLLSSISKVWNAWLVSVIISSAAVLVGIAALWRYLVIPVRAIVHAIGETAWGRNVPRFEPFLLYEVGALSEVIEKSAADAVAKEQLRLRYISDIVQAQEEARRRMARELHDGPLQSVVASIKRLQLAQIAHSAQNSGAGEALDEAERISQYAANEIRNYCDDLSPSWLALGVSSALDEMAERLSETYNVRVDVSAGDCKLPEEYSLAIIRILQEAVSNAVRHGGASSVDVSLAMEEGELVFRVADDGKGFEALPSDYEQLRLEGHRGLSNMYERVQLLGGRLEINSRPGEGAVISVWIKI